MKLGIIGAGNMASAIIGGIIKKGIIAGNEIICSSPVDAEREKAAASFGINVTADNKEVVKSSEIILLAVKPQVIPVVAAEIKDVLKDDQLIISIVALLCIIAIPLIYYRYVYYQTRIDLIWTTSLPTFNIIKAYPLNYIPYYILGAFYLLMTVFYQTSLSAKWQKSYFRWGCQTLLVAALVAGV